MTTDKEEAFLLLKILPEQVSDKWEVFAPLIELSLPPTVYNRRLRMANVLRSVLVGELQVWIYIDEQKNERFIMSTVEQLDRVSLSKSLLIYSFTSLVGQLKPIELERSFEKLKTYAKSIKCQSIIAYVDDVRVKKFLESNGAKANFSLIQMEI